MNRSVLLYPLARGIDGDSAADLQTDIMRFMAILSLCLVAIFALVQSIPLVPGAQEPDRTNATASPAAVEKPQPAPPRAAAIESATTPAASKTPLPPARLSRPAAVAQQAAIAPRKKPERVATNDREQGFTLRFASDLALTRLVAANEVGFFAIAPGRARRMAVSDSRISFWDASMPATFHEMEASTVPQPVVDALVRAGVDAAAVNWGVTLPPKLSDRLATIVREHTGGALVIDGDGRLALDAS